MADNIPFTDLDFARVKENLKTYLKGQSQFKDFDFEGSNMNVLLDVLAYNTFQNNFYNNMMFSEMFLDSAQLRQSALSHAKELNYLPASRRSATSKLNLNFSPFDSPNTITIVKGTKFIAQCGNKSYTFVTDRNYVANAVNGYQIVDMPVYEGRYVTEFITVDTSDPKQEFVISNENVDISSIRVNVRTNTNVNSDKSEYVRKNSIFGVATTDNVFYVETTFDNLYKVTFGRNRFGRQPVNGNVIEIEYIVTKGEEVNGASNFKAASNISGYTPIITSFTSAVNGSERESIEDIRFFAPKSIQVQERAVTKSDYEILLKQEFPNIQTISVYGGDEVDPPQYGKVIISVDVFGTDGAGDSEIALFKEFIQDKTPLTIEPVFVPAKFMYVDLEVEIVYDRTVTRRSEAELRTIAINAINNFSVDNLNKFSSTLRQSRLSNAIDSSDSSFVSTDIFAKPIIQFAPDLGDITNPIFNFGAELVKPYAYNDTLGFTSYKPAITSSKFVLEGTTVELRDDGQGRVIAVTASASDERVFKRDIGTIDYATGQIRLSNFIVDSFTGNAIKIIANTVKKDISSTKDRILVLREEDINLRITAA